MVDGVNWVARTQAVGSITRLLKVWFSTGEAKEKNIEEEIIDDGRKRARQERMTNFWSQSSGNFKCIMEQVERNIC